MAGRTNYTPTPAAFDPEVHIDAAQAHFDALIGETVANALALPASGNWPGREITVLDLRDTYRWFTGDGWVKVRAATRHAEYTTSISLANSTNGTVGVMTQDEAASQNDDFITVTSPGVFALKKGVYSISIFANLTAASSGLTIAGFAFGAIPYRMYFPTGTQFLMFTHPNLAVVADDSEISTYLFQITGATRTVTGRVAITKVA